MMSEKQKSVALWLFKTLWDADESLYPEEIKRHFPSSVEPEEIDEAVSTLLALAVIRQVGFELSVTQKGLDWDGVFE